MLQMPFMKEMTSEEKILAFMKPWKEYLVSDIHIGTYEVGTRLWDLCRSWKVKRVGSKKGKKWQQFALYSLNI